jgi:protoporphyrinogen/coproporphyrinogen III oxidase
VSQFVVSRLVSAMVENGVVLMDNASDADVIIVGGGISGLATAWFLRESKPSIRVLVLEAEAGVGGKISSTSIGGVQVDSGPDAFLARVEGAVELAHALGLGDDLIAPATGKAWLWSRNKLRALPDGLVLGVPSRFRPLATSGILSTSGLARAAWGAVRGGFGSYAALGDDPTVTQAIGRHLGQEVVDRLVDPLLGGINASSSARLSLRSAAANLAGSAASPRLMTALREQGAAAARGNIGVEVGAMQRPVFLAPRSGVHALVEQLHQQLGDVISSGVRVSVVSSSSPISPPATRTERSATVESGQSRHGWAVETSVGTLRAQSVILATPAFISAQLIQQSNPPAAQEMSAIRTASVALTQLTFPSSAAQLPKGSGMLVPRVENRFLTASSWWNQKWPHLQIPGQVLIRASTGRDGDDRFTQLDDDEVVRQLYRDLRDMLGIVAPPTEARVTRWNNGFPQYDAGHAARVTSIQGALAATPGLFVTGASYNGIGIPACIRSAKAVAASCLATVA